MELRDRAEPWDKTRQGGLGAAPGGSAGRDVKVKMTSGGSRQGDTGGQDGAGLGAAPAVPGLDPCSSRPQSPELGMEEQGKNSRARKEPGSGGLGSNRGFL